MIVHLQRSGKHVATLNLPFPPRSGDRIYLSYQELLAAQPHMDPGDRLNHDALLRLQDLDGTTWEVEGTPTWEMRFHAKGQYDPIYRVPVMQA